MEGWVKSNEGGKREGKFEMWLQLNIVERAKRWLATWMKVKVLMATWMKVKVLLSLVPVFVLCSLLTFLRPISARPTFQSVDISAAS